MAQANAATYADPVYSSLSWHCLFAGYGTFPPPAKMRPLPQGASGADAERVEHMLEACQRNFPDYSTG